MQEALVRLRCGLARRSTFENIMRQYTEFFGKEFQKTLYVSLCRNKTNKDTRLGDASLIPHPSCPASCVLGPKDAGRRTGPKGGRTKQPSRQQNSRTREERFSEYFDIM
eukprot:6313512-Ditylum_brightwellii.AAC.1